MCLPTTAGKGSDMQSDDLFCRAIEQLESGSAVQRLRLHKRDLMDKERLLDKVIEGLINTRRTLWLRRLGNWLDKDLRYECKETLIFLRNSQRLLEEAYNDDEKLDAFLEFISHRLERIEHLKAKIRRTSDPKKLSTLFLCYMIERLTILIGHEGELPSVLGKELANEWKDDPENPFTLKSRYSVLSLR